MKELKELKKWFILIIFAILSYWLVNNFNVITDLVMKIINVLFPFILGGILAFILNIPMVKIETLLNKKFKNKKVNRIVSITLSLLIFVLIILFIAFLLIPELVSNIELLVSSLPSLITNVQESIVNLLSEYPDVQIEIQKVFAESGNINNILTNILNYIINGAIGFVKSLISSVVTLFTGIVFAIYMLSQKEYLKNCFEKLIIAYTKKEYVTKIFDFFNLVKNTFSKFISGQCLEAVILGCIFFVVLNIFKFPYALIISVLTAVTALIPVFGAMIAMIIGAILIAITNPIQALLFIAVFQIIQQIEGNFIYPRVVGKSVGLSPMWTLLAITVGGNLFGIIGMLLGLPLASIVYVLIKNDANERILEK